MYLVAKTDNGFSPRILSDQHKKMVKKILFSLAPRAIILRSPTNFRGLVRTAAANEHSKLRVTVGSVMVFDTEVPGVFEIHPFDPSLHRKRPPRLEAESSDCTPPQTENQGTRPLTHMFHNEENACKVSIHAMVGDRTCLGSDVGVADETLTLLLTGILPCLRTTIGVS